MVGGGWMIGKGRGEEGEEEELITRWERAHLIDGFWQKSLDERLPTDR